jgi:hypothetical protein
LQETPQPSISQLNQPRDPRRLICADPGQAVDFRPASRF